MDARLDHGSIGNGRLVALVAPTSAIEWPETGQLLGNFPQACTHVGLIHAAMTIGALLDVRDAMIHVVPRHGQPAMTIGALLDVRDGRVRAWILPHEAAVRRRTHAAGRTPGTGGRP